MIRLVELSLGREEEEAVLEVLRSGRLAQGPRVAELEGEFAEYLGVPWALAVSSGTAALELSLRALGIGPGDEVVVPPFTFIATANAVLWVGARPIFADVSPDTLTLDPEAVKEAIGPRTKAVIAVHLFGHPADLRALSEICEDAHLHLIEDAAQAHGAEAWGRKVGSFGTLAAFSLYATKNMTSGEGGIIVGHDEGLRKRIKLLRNQGQEEKYLHVSLGMNYRLTEIQAALALVQLGRLEENVEARRRNAVILNKLLKGVVETPREEPWARHVYHQYAVLLPEGTPRERIRKRMLEKGVETAVHYPRIIPEQPLYRRLGYDAACCPVSLAASRRVLSLPVHQGLGREELEKVAASLKRALES